jgi:hypothetical protein
MCDVWFIDYDLFFWSCAHCVIYQVEAVIHFEDDTEELQQWDQQVCSFQNSHTFKIWNYDIKTGSQNFNHFIMVKLQFGLNMEYYSQNWFREVS